MMKCKVCDNPTDDAGDGLFYCPVCGRILSGLDVAPMPQEEAPARRRLNPFKGIRAPAGETTSKKRSASAILRDSTTLLGIAWIGTDMPLLLLLGLLIGCSELKQAITMRDTPAVWTLAICTLVVLLVTLYTVFAPLSDAMRLLF